ncbi:unnamed protein product [Pylaiella littoralis]
MLFQDSCARRDCYGSLEHSSDGDVAKLCVLPGVSDRASFDHTRERRGRGEQSSRKKWVSLSVGFTLAVGVMLGLAQAGYRMPATPARDISPSGTSGRSGMTQSENSSTMMQASQVKAPSRSSGGSSGREESRASHSAKVPSRSAVTAESSIAPLSFTALNFYHVRDGKPALDYPWLKDVKLIEPHRETTLAVSAPRKGLEYRWEIRGDSSASAVHTSVDGAEAIVVLETKHLEENLVTLEEVDAEGRVLRRLCEKVMVKYVRREIRTLTDEEREELFDAMFELWRVRVEDGDGREVYGDSYSDIWAINRLHFKAASPQFCDHFHDGLGFLTSHSLLSNTFEHSLQQVNPKLTLPYWDFTIESSSAGAAAAEGLDNMFGSEIKTPLLQESWFGTTDPATNMVQNGRWAFTQIPKMRPNNPGQIEPDVYSNLRSPWVVNDRPFITRGMGKMCQSRAEDFYKWPTCEMHHDLVTSFTNFYSWVWESLYDPHGAVHIWIGGVLDCEETYAGDVGELVGTDTASDLAMLAFVHRKDMFRAGIFSCEGKAPVSETPDDVSEPAVTSEKRLRERRSSAGERSRWFRSWSHTAASSRPRRHDRNRHIVSPARRLLFEAGVCGCHGYDLTQGDDFLEIFDMLVFIEELTPDLDEDTKRKLVATLCSSKVNDGDHLQSSSSLDPSFWSTHPTMERLWMYTVLTGQITDYTWPDSDVTLTASDGTAYTESISKYSEDCLGHRGSDVFPFDLLAGDSHDFTVQTGIKGNPSDGGNIFTNREVLGALDPRMNALSYVYDTFEWKHCEADGFDLGRAWLANGGAGGSTSAKGIAAAGPPAPNTPPLSQRQSVNGRTVFEKDALRFPLYGTLTAKMVDLQKRKQDLAR